MTSENKNHIWYHMCSLVSNIYNCMCKWMCVDITYETKKDHKRIEVMGNEGKAIGHSGHTSKKEVRGIGKRI